MKRAFIILLSVATAKMMHVIKMDKQLNEYERLDHGEGK